MFSGIDALVLYEECSVASDGTLVTDATTVTQTGRQLKVGESGGGGGGGSSMSFSSGVGTIVGGSSRMNINGIDVISSHNSISLKGKDSTKLIVNGKATTFGAVMRGGGGGGKATPAPEKKVFKLDPASRIGALDVFCDTSDVVKIDPRFASDSLTVAVQGSGKVELPGKVFTSLSVRVTGNGAVHGADPDHERSAITTKAKSLGIAVTGNGSCTDIIALGPGSIAVTGNGNVDISAIDKRQITKQVAGNGEVRIRQESANESSAMAAIDAAIEAVSSLAANRAGWVPLSRAAPVKRASPTPIDTVREEVFAKVLAMAETKVKEEKARKADSDSTVKRRRVKEEPDD